MFGDEAFFGLSRRVHHQEVLAHIDGHAPIVQRAARDEPHRVTVWGAVGLDVYTPFIVFDNGKCLTGPDYGRMMDSTIIPDLQ